jgi:hypothetical protein
VSFYLPVRMTVAGIHYQARFRIQAAQPTSQELDSRRTFAFLVKKLREIPFPTMSRFLAIVRLLIRLVLMVFEHRRGRPLAFL